MRSLRAPGLYAVLTSAFPASLREVVKLDGTTVFEVQRPADEAPGAEPGGTAAPR